MKVVHFQIIDENGYITEADLKKIMSAFGEPLN